MRIARAAATPFDAVARWPWHKAIGVWAEAREAEDGDYRRTWEPLLKVWYRDD